MLNILYLLPKNILSRIVGFLMHIELPDPLRVWAISKFAQYYKINVDEAEKPLSVYRSIGSYFVRGLVQGARPIAVTQIVHPADALISQVAQIKSGNLIQAKGKIYTINKFLQDELAIKKYEGGVFFTYYLCPTDYHRVHSPVEGEVRSITYVPGTLWPVNDWSVNRIEELFCVNERVIIEILANGPNGKYLVSLALVGATNVGKISLSFERRIVSNQGETKTCLIEYKAGTKFVRRGEELGIFHMGSTVVLCVAPQAFPREYPLDVLIQSHLQQRSQMGAILY